MKRIKEITYLVISLIIVFVIGYYFKPALSYLNSDHINFEHQSISNLEHEEIVLVYIGSSTCGPSNKPEVFSQVDSLNNELSAYVKNKGYGYVSVGISKDWNINEGLKHLSNFETFDEVMTGRNWNNTGVSRYVYDVIPGQAITPQIVITRRVNGKYSTINSEYYRGIDSERELLRIAGSDEISDPELHSTIKNLIK